MPRKRGRPKGSHSRGGTHKKILTAMHRRALRNINQLKKEINSAFRHARKVKM